MSGTPRRTGGARTAASLPGALFWRAGVPRPHNLRSTRPHIVDRLVRGLPAQRLAPTLASLFSLCGHAHATVANLALDAALGRGLAVQSPPRATLALHTVREHLRRIALDWPRLARSAPGDAGVEAHADSGADAAAARTLAACPLFARGAAASPVEAAAAAPWMQSALLGMPPREWLAAWERDPAGWLSDWCRSARGPAAEALRGCLPLAGMLLPDVAPLRVHADAAALREWTMQADAQCRIDAQRDVPFDARGDERDATRTAPAPIWRNACAETGVWTRLREPNPHGLNTPLLRLGARLAEAARLALPDADGRDGTAWLDLGALPLGEGEAIAWAETARGLLMHRLVLDGRGDAARVAACRVVAPTDWNFHPDGAVARLLERLPRDAVPAARRRLALAAAAYDPCVPFEEDASMTEKEAAHA